jgi:hypothetical protein
LAQESPKSKPGREKLLHNYDAIGGLRFPKQGMSCKNAPAREFIGVSENPANPAVETGKRKWLPSPQFHLAVLDNTAGFLHFDSAKEELGWDLSSASFLQTTQAAGGVEEKHTQARAGVTIAFKAAP